MLPTCQKDLWEFLSETKKHIILYGMGNGADKILDILKQKGLHPDGIFASDGFARGNLFRGMKVETWATIKERFGKENVVVLLSFGTSRPEVLENILRIKQESELYAPDVPAFGNTLFDRLFFESHRTEAEQVRSLFADEESRRIFDAVIHYKLTGDIDRLLQAESNFDEVWNDILNVPPIRFAVDLGAYNGDSVQELLDRTNGSVRRVRALEPDRRNFAKLKAYAEKETRAEVLPYALGAWSEEQTLFFDRSGNRNASLLCNRSESLSDRPITVTEVQATAPDNVLNGEQVDYIKYDVEGSEREAILGSSKAIRQWKPTLMVSLYHRSEDLFTLPLMIHERFPFYNAYYLRRARGIPAWDLNLYVKSIGTTSDDRFTPKP